MIVTHLEFKCRIWRLWYTTIAFAGVNVPGKQVGEAYWLLFFDSSSSSSSSSLNLAKATTGTGPSDLSDLNVAIPGRVFFRFVNVRISHPSKFCSWWVSGSFMNLHCPMFVIYMSCVTVYTYIYSIYIYHMCLHNIYTWYLQTVGCVDLSRDVKWTGLVPKAGFSSLAPTPELPWTPGKWS